MLVNGVILLMTAWLFYKANSITPTIGFAIGTSMLLMLTMTRRFGLVHFVTALAPVVLVIAFVILDLDTYAASAVGRDVSLTGRTELWGEVLRIHDSPLLGAGFESFWLGPRADYLWDKFWWRPNQAHNGYLETYLNLGLVGLMFLATLVVSGYAHIMKTFRRDPGLAAFMLGLFSAICVYNLTEAAFKGIHPLWIAFLLAVAAPVLADNEQEAIVEETKPQATGPRILETEWARRQAQVAGGMSNRARTGASAR
jgi:O-antigen ligase